LLGLIDDLNGKGNGTDGVNWHYRKQTVEELGAMERTATGRSSRRWWPHEQSWIERRGEKKAVREAFDARPVIFFTYGKPCRGSGHAVEGRSSAKKEVKRCEGEQSI
jgi:hypothetical protein